MSMMNANILLLLLVIIGLLLHINHKLPKRDYAKEAMELDRACAEKDRR